MATWQPEAGVTGHLGQPLNPDADFFASPPPTIADGVYTVKSRGGREGFFSSQGVYKFSYESIANARLFQVALAVVWGVRFDDDPTAST